MDAVTLGERVAALKHDLGKYVAWMSINLDDEAWTGPMTDQLVAALRSDLLATKKGTDGDRTAWEVWLSHTEDLPRPLQPPELATVEAAVAVLQAAGPALQAGDHDAIAPLRAGIREAQQTIRKTLATVHRSLLAAARAEQEASEAEV